ncbi:hypothetical protein GQ457_07G020210 [Hibiscus cannabinus]
MSIKIDLKKAYDRLEWGFINETLQDIDLSDSFHQLNMQCVSTVSTQILWNETPTTSFCPSRSIQQDDPLSSYHFYYAWNVLRRLFRLLVECWMIFVYALVIK